MAGAGASNYQPKLKPVGTDVCAGKVEILDNYQNYFSQIFGRTVASENQEALSDWLKYASPEGTLISHYIVSPAWITAIVNPHAEQHTVLKMLKSAEATQVNDVSCTFSNYSNVDQ